MSEHPTTEPLAAELAGIIADTVTTGVGDATIRSIRPRLLDALGTIIGAVNRPVMDATRTFLAAAGRVPGEWFDANPGAAQLVPGREARITTANLGYIHGAAAFIDNYSDTSLRSVIHPNTVVVPAAIAASRETAVNGATFLRAIIAGYQVSEVLGRMLNDGTPRMAHQVRGFRPTASCGPAGVAATAAAIRGLDQDETARAISLACNMAAGLRRTDAGEFAHMRVHSGEATSRGIEAVLMEQAGIRLDDLFLESPGGFLEAMSAGELGTPAVHPAGTDDWYINDVAIKLHATPHTLAPTLDCLLELTRADPGAIGKIREVRTFLPTAHAAISLGAAQADPSTLTAAEALDHLPFCAGLVLRSGQIVLPTLPESYIRDADVIDAARRVQIIPDEEQSQIFNRQAGSWPVRVEVDVDGETLEMSRMHPRGIDLEEDGVIDDLKLKYDALSAPLLGQERSARLAAFVEGIESSQDVYADLRAAIID